MKFLSFAKVFVVLFFGLLFERPSLAQEDDPGANLPKALQQEYMRKRLGIEIINQTSGGFYYNKDYGFGGSAATTTRKWKGYQGFNTVSEADFYLAAGYEAEAQQIRQWKTTGGLLALAGAVVYAVGFSMMIEGLDSENEDQAIKGLGLSLGASIPLGIGIFRLTSKKTSVGQASISANHYNRRLADDLRSGR